MIVSVSLEARTGTFVTDIDRSAKQAERALKKMEAESRKSLREFGNHLKVAGAAAAAGLAVIVGAVLKASVDSEKATAALASALRGANGATADSVVQLKALAEELQRTTTFEDDAIVSSLALLATFRNISVNEFPRAQRAILDVASALGKDLNSAAELVGRALNEPLKAVRSLRAAHIALSPALQKTNKELVETGRAAESRSLILGEFEKAFGGRAVDATKTFGGALLQLKNAFGNLLEGEGGSLTEASEAVNRLTEVLNSPSVKASFQSLTSAILEATAAVVEFSASLIDLEGEGIQGIQTLAEIKNPAGIFERILQNLPDHMEGAIRKFIEWRRVILDTIGAIDDLSPKLLLLSEAQARSSGTFSGLIQRTPAPAVPAQGSGLTTSLINPLLSEDQIRATKKAFEEARRLQEAFARGNAEIFEAMQDRERAALEASFDARAISHRQYLDEKLRLTEDEIDQEIEASKSLLQNAAQDEAILLQARIDSLEIRREIARDEHAAEEATHVRELAAAYDDADRAAKSYVDEISREGQRTLEAFDQSPAQRRFNAGRFQIEDKFRSDVESLGQEGHEEAEYERRLALLQGYHEKALAEHARYFDLIEEKQKDFTTSFNNAIQEYVDATSNVGAALGDTLVEAIDHAIESTSRLAAEMILFGGSGKDAIYQLARSIATELLSSLIRVGVQLLINKTLLSAFGGASGAAIPLPGRASGGYAGDIPPNKIAGVYHGQEFIVNAQATRKNRDVLEAINAGTFSADSTSVPRSSSQGLKPTTNVRIINVPDKTYIKDYLMGDEGDEVFTNWVGRNSARIKSVVAT